MVEEWWKPMLPILSVISLDILYQFFIKLWNENKCAEQLVLSGLGTSKEKIGCINVWSVVKETDPQSVGILQSLVCVTNIQSN